MKYTLPLLVFTLFLISATAQDAVQKANAEAIRIYPALAQKDSPLNKAFVALYAQAKQSNPKLLATPDWPLTLARQAAASLVVAPNVAQPAVQAVEEPKAVPDALVGDKQKVEKPDDIYMISWHIIRQKIDGGLLLVLKPRKTAADPGIEPPRPLTAEVEKMRAWNNSHIQRKTDHDPYVLSECFLRGHPYYQEYVDGEAVVFAMQVLCSAKTDFYKETRNPLEPCIDEPPQRLRWGGARGGT